MAGIDREELRHLVRQALRETLADGTASAPAQGVAEAIRAALTQPKPATIPVSLGTAADLNDFVRAILGAAEDADGKAAIASGEIRFVPADAKAAARETPSSTGGATSFDKGVLGESKVVELSRKGRRIVIGKAVVVTPLAREKARQLKVELVRQKP